jgi:hypothetical protein
MTKVTLRKFPYPFKSALTLCSDLDGTCTAEKFLAIQTFLNTERDTDMGPGVGLEIGNSFFPKTGLDTFSYISNNPNDRLVIKDFIQAGYIDCMHSYGEGVYTRDNVLSVLDMLERDGCKVDVWVDHARAPTNIGKYSTHGLGDKVGTSVYHTDATLAYGIKFAWMGRDTGVVGQDAALTTRALRHIYDPAYPSQSAKNLIKELAKIFLAQVGSKRFAIYLNNKLIRANRLLDGQWVYEFIRCNNHWNKPRPNSTGLSYVLCNQALDDLKLAEGYMIIYTHLGMGNYSPLLPLDGQSALRNLSEEYRSGEIYVSTTSRILNYYLVRHNLEWSFDISPDGWTKINIHKVNDPIFGSYIPTLEELQGITFYVPDRNQVTISLGNNRLEHLEHNPKDYTGRESVMIPRTYLTYPH